MHNTNRTPKLSKSAPNKRENTYNLSERKRSNLTSDIDETKNLDTPHNLHSKRETVLS